MRGRVPTAASPPRAPDLDTRDPGSQPAPNRWLLRLRKSFNICPRYSYFHSYRRLARTVSELAFISTPCSTRARAAQPCSSSGSRRTRRSRCASGRRKCAASSARSTDRSIVRIHPIRARRALCQQAHEPQFARSDIKREEMKVKTSIKQAAKRGDMSSAKTLASEIVRSRKAVNRLHTTKAQMNSVMMQMENQMGQKKLMGSLQKSSVIMGAMNRLVKVEGISQTMQSMQQEMCRVRTPRLSPRARWPRDCRLATPA